MEKNENFVVINDKKYKIKDVEDALREYSDYLTETSDDVEYANKVYEMMKAANAALAAQETEIKRRKELCAATLAAKAATRTAGNVGVER